MAGRRLLVRVTAVDGDVVALEAGLTEGPYAFGRLRWLEGRNAGLTQIVLASDAEGVTLADAPPFAVAAGTLAELTQGCDKRLESCAARFGNAANFRGEPYLPGNDLLTRYPGGSLWTGARPWCGRRVRFWACRSDRKSKRLNPNH